jgi:signal transduction histidine kinase/CheY-like chemotaxis protein
VLSRFLLLFLPAAMFCIIGAVTLFKSETNANLTKVRSSETAAIQLGVNSVGLALQSITSDLAYLAAQGGFIDLISNGGQAPNDHHIADWLAFSHIKGVYDQIRWLDLHGQERLRVNYNNGKPVQVAEDRLQNKRKRYYFADAVKLNRGEFFISPLDLNIERGEIEQPLKPMIRIGTPVYDQKGNKQGIILLNYLGEKMLLNFGQSVGEASSRAWLLNRDGYWLKGPSTGQEWGFMYQRPEASASYNYPGSWKRIMAANDGQFEDEQGLWTFGTIYPLSEGQKTSSGTYEAFAPSRSSMESRDYFWKAVLFLPQEQYRAISKQTGFKLLMASTVLLAGLFIFCWWLASAWVHRMKAEEKVHGIKEAQQTLIASSRMEVSQTFAGGIAHLINNQMAAVIGNAGLLKMKNPNDANLIRLVDRISTSAGMASQLADELVAFTHGGKYNTENLNLANIAAVTIEQMQCTAGNEVVIEQRLDANIRSVKADKSQMLNVFANLVENAIEAIEGSGKVTVSVSNFDADDEFMQQHPEFSSSQLVHVAVADTGAGIDEHLIGKVFEPFVTSKFQGRGLGLAAVYGIVINHGGHLEVSSTPGQGSRFDIYLPAVVEQPLVAEARYDETEDVNLKGCSILLVEDDSNVVDVFTEMFGSDGCTVYQANNGKQAIAQARAHANEIDVILLEIIMPEMGGYEVVPVLREINPEMQIIISAIHKNDEEVGELLERGVYGVLQKPVQIPELRQMIMDAWKHG